MEILADKLAAELAPKSAAELRRLYDKTVRQCDEAWEGVEGAFSSRLFVLARESHEEFRHLYAQKVRLYGQVLQAEAR